MQRLRATRDGYVGARASRGEMRYRETAEDDPREFGLTLMRAYYAPLGGSGKGWVPQAELGIADGYTPG